MEHLPLVGRKGGHLHLEMDVLALQETHLAPVPLETAHTTARVRGLRLHHGRPAVPTPGGTWGRACGVGFLAVEAVALQVVLPHGAAWRRLHAIRRVHAVRLAPRPGLPRGLLLVSVYAPQQSRALEVERLQFAATFLDFVHSLDMQVPTLLLGSFNGTTCPSRDYMSGGAGRLACPLLMRLLGPGGPLVDVQVALLGDTALDWTYRNVDSTGRVSGSRIDLVLANQAALILVQGVKVLAEVRDGGHSPVVVSLCAPVVRLSWRRPRPQLCRARQWSCGTLRSGRTCWSAGLPTMMCRPCWPTRHSCHLTSSPWRCLRHCRHWCSWLVAGESALQCGALPMSPMRCAACAGAWRCCTGWRIVCSAALQLLGASHGNGNNGWPGCGVLGCRCRRDLFQRSEQLCRLLCKKVAFGLVVFCGRCGRSGRRGGGRQCPVCGVSGLPWSMVGCAVIQLHGALHLFSTALATSVLQWRPWMRQCGNFG